MAIRLGFPIKDLVILNTFINNFLIDGSVCLYDTKTSTTNWTDNLKKIHLKVRDNVTVHCGLFLIRYGREGKQKYT